MIDQNMKQSVLENFEKVFGKREGIKTYFAPGRVNLIGEHTDYNGGHVFPCALTIGTYAAVAKRDDRVVQFYSVNQDRFGVYGVNLDDIDTINDQAGWTNYPIGVIWAFAGRGMKLDKGFDMVINGNIPNGSGLSSSASLEVLTGFILRDLYGFDVTNQDIALIGQYSENNYNGCNCGIMDQFASAMGKENNAIFLDTADLSYEYAPIKLDGAKIVIANTNKKHKLTDSQYNARRSMCEEALAILQKTVDIKGLGDLSIEEFEAHKDVLTDPDMQKKAKHAVYENQRTIEAVKALKAGDIEHFGELMRQSHESLRDDYDVTGVELDTLAEEAWKIPGVIGSRMTGGGFGGCTVSIVKDEAVEDFKRIVGENYLKKIGYEATFYTVEIGGGPQEI
ncbi:galactokinase GalK [Butyrivibrio proteoclasticus B316]|uniref:Galactokinase n=1 Tax=Butyrivibrio proteoclasticus (strain ATCC 51982 / DSM 14932 / B316) TaxID=515622 RepID=E0S086_BUTPB|nr:galactokinase [Butyrivibrio proteoclasticus]ADL35573.1 galactokinase GalK [Butyrivibrio proteoclasticus B316]